MQKASGYNNRARVEAAIGRYKRVVGDGLRSRTDYRRRTEVAIAVHVLNQMLEFGARSPAASHELRRSWICCAPLAGPCNTLPRGGR
jgi:hypothetical protein